MKTGFRGDGERPRCSAACIDEVDEKKYNLDALKRDIKHEFELIDIIQKQLQFFEENDTN